MLLCTLNQISDILLSIIVYVIVLRQNWLGKESNYTEIALLSYGIFINNHL